MYGNRRDVWEGLKQKTAGGLTKSDLFKRGDRILSKRVSEQSKKNTHLREYAFKTKDEQK